MYPIVPKSWWSAGLAVVALLTVLALKVVEAVGLSMNDWRVAMVTASGVGAAFWFLFGGAGPNAPWRVAWRLVPRLNHWVFPDLNGVWVGATSSNWPTLEKMLETAQARRVVDKEELHNIPERQDAIAIEVRSSLFNLSVCAGLSSTGGKAHSTAARIRRSPYTGALQIAYIYDQETPTPEITDQDRHVGAAELEFDQDDGKKAEGIYWTRRSWRAGLNTAGRLQLRKICDRREHGKSLQYYAGEERKRMDAT